MNTKLRKEATKGFEKDLYKLMNNSVFGKTMENLRKRVDVKLVRGVEENKLRKLICSPLFNGATIFDDNLAGVDMHKTALKLNRPVYVEMSILDLSKNLMYITLKTKYGNCCDLLYTYTDSLLVQIQTEDVYKDMDLQPHLYDTSNYPTDL